MSIKVGIALLFSAVAVTAPAVVNVAHASAREEGRLLTATEVLEEVQGMPDQRLPDALLSRAYGIAVIPDVTKIAFIFGGRHGNGVLVVRDKLNAPWSNPVFVSLTGGSWGFQAGAQSSDIILVFTTRAGVEGIAGGKLTLGADASVAAGPYGRQGSAATDVALRGNLFVCPNARPVRRNCVGRQRHLDRSFRERVLLPQERGNGERDPVGTGAGGTRIRAAIPRPIGAVDAHRRENLARTASGPARGLLCRPAPAGGAARGGSAAHVSPG